MEPAATSLLVPPPRKLGQIRRALWWAFWAILSLVTGGFAWGLYRARHSARDLALVGADFYPTYGAIWAFCLCLTRHRDDDDPERRRVRLAALAVSLLLGASVGLRVAGATPRLVLNGLSIGLAFYFLFPARGRRDARADDGSLAGGDLHEVSQEQRA
ncbi:unnamed protein product [Alopecurus aequalis]